VTSSSLDALVGRAAAAQPQVAALGLDARLARAARARAALAAIGPAVVDAAVAEVGQPRRFARRELESPRWRMHSIIGARSGRSPPGACRGEFVVRPTGRSLAITA
jgi:hypothetical protein